MIKRFKFYPTEFKLEIGFETKTKVWLEGELRIVKVTYHHYQFFKWGIKRTKEPHFHLQKRGVFCYKNKEFNMLYSHIFSDIESMRTKEHVLCIGSTDRINNLKDAVALIKNQSFDSMYNIIDKNYYQVLKQYDNNYKFVVVTPVKNDNV